MNDFNLNAIHADGVVAIIPARSGSQSVPKKNIRPWRGYPLMAYSIAAAKLSRRISRIIVSTDTEEFAAVARVYGAEVPFLRPAELAGNTSQDVEFIAHAMKALLEQDGCVPEYFVHLRPTTPMRDWRVIDKAIDAILADPEATSLRSATLCPQSPFKWFKRGKGCYFDPLMQGMTCDDANMPRQVFPDVFVPNGYVDVVRTSYVLESGLLHGDKMIGFETNQVTDIDSEQDLKDLDACSNEAVLNELIACIEELLAARAN